MTALVAELGLPPVALAGCCWLLDPEVPRRTRLLALLGSRELRHTLAVLRRWALVDHQDEPTEAGAQFARQVDHASRHAGPDGMLRGGVR